MVRPNHDPGTDPMCPQQERRDLTARRRALRQLYGEWVRDGNTRGYMVHVIASAYDRGALDKSAELVAEFQAVITKLRADITQDKPAPLRGGDGERT